MLLERLQTHLETIYGIRCALRAKDFLLDQQQALLLGASGRSREELLVAGGGEGLELGLYLHPELLAPKDLGAFCEAAEGVSHFVYLTRSAELERRVSLLELEAQAEVDKFAICALGRWDSRRADAFEVTFEQIFDQVRYRDSLTGDELDRYREANRLARAFCARLLPILAARSLERLLAVLRYCYRLGSKAKLEHLGGAR